MDPLVSSKQANAWHAGSTGGHLHVSTQARQRSGGARRPVRMPSVKAGFMSMSMAGFGDCLTLSLGFLGTRGCRGCRGREATAPAMPQGGRSRQAEPATATGHSAASEGAGSGARLAYLRLCSWQPQDVQLAASGGSAARGGGGAQESLLLVIPAVAAAGRRLAGDALAPAHQQRSQRCRGRHQGKAAGGAVHHEPEHAAVVQALPQPGIWGEQGWGGRQQAMRGGTKHNSCFRLRLGRRRCSRRRAAAGRLLQRGPPHKPPTVPPAGPHCPTQQAPACGLPTRAHHQPSPLPSPAGLTRAAGGLRPLGLWQRQHAVLVHPLAILCSNPGGAERRALPLAQADDARALGARRAVVAVPRLAAAEGRRRGRAM